MLRLADKPFIIVREEALCLMCEEEARVVEIRLVKKAAPALSGAVGGSVSYVLGFGRSCDGGVTAGDVGMYLYVSDVSVACGGDVKLGRVDTVLSDSVSGGLAV